MLILLLFAFIAGIATVLSPCIIPILPSLLSAGVGKGRLRPIGIILGIIISFCFFTLLLRILIQATGISPNVLRYIAIAIIALFGLVMIFPRLSDRFAALTSSIANAGSKLQTSESVKGSGFFSGFILGISLGLLWTPCAGPILAAIIAIVATSSVTLWAALLIFTYSIGAAIPMFCIVYGGNRALTSSRTLAKHAEGIRKVFGVLMLLSVFILAGNWDTYFTQMAIRYFPFLQVDDNAIVRQELNSLRGNAGASPFTAKEASPSTGLPVYGKPPEFTKIAYWINSVPLTLPKLKGKVVLVDFWTYSCINCIRTFPYLKEWYAKYKDKGFTIIGVHTPEFPFEKDRTNVEQAAKRFDITYPIALDNEYGTWNAYGNIYWPAHYLIDQNGLVREIHYGEGKYLETENAIRSLLQEAPLAGEKEMPLPHKYETPETYLGYDRADRYATEIKIQPNENSLYSYTKPLEKNQVGLKGKWMIRNDYIEPGEDNSEIDLNFVAKNVYLVINGASAKPIQVSLDDNPVPQKYRTDDMNEQGEIFIKEARKYDIVDMGADYGNHTLSLKVPKGVKIYVFTFGS